MRTFLIAQICFVLLGISNSVPTGDWYDSGLFDSASKADHPSHTTTNGRQGEELKCVALAKTSRGQTLVHVADLDFSRRCRCPFAQNVFWGQHQKVTRSTLMLTYLHLLKVQTNRKGPPYTFPKFDEYGDLPFTREKERLDYFAQELKSVPREPGYIIEYRNKRQNQKPLARAKRAKNYLVKVKGVDAYQIRLVNGGYEKEFKIELRLGPVGSQ